MYKIDQTWVTLENTSSC